MPDRSKADGHGGGGRPPLPDKGQARLHSVPEITPSLAGGGDQGDQRSVEQPPLFVPRVVCLVPEGGGGDVYEHLGRTWAADAEGGMSCRRVACMSPLSELLQQQVQQPQKAVGQQQQQQTQQQQQAMVAQQKQQQQQWAENNFRMSYDPIANITSWHCWPDATVYSFDGTQRPAWQQQQFEDTTATEQHGACSIKTEGEKGTVTKNSSKTDLASPL